MEDQDINQSLTNNEESQGPALQHNYLLTMELRYSMNWN